jgi:hypothetical protein
MSRQQLYDLVWKEPMLRVGERLGVSSSYMARVCTELRIPRPPRGYWAQLEFGKAPARPGLPEARPGDIPEWSPGDFIGNNERAAGTRAKKDVESDGVKEADPTVVIRPRPRLKSKADQRHELVMGLKHHFEKTRASDTGILRPFKRLMVDVMSSKENLDAAISAADKLFLTLAARGHRVTIAPSGVQMRRAEVDLRETARKNHYQQAPWSPERPTVVYIGDVAIGLTLFEMTQATEMQYIGSSTYVPVSSLSQQQLRRYEQARYWTSTQDKASGRLRLQAYCPSWRVAWVKQWSEAKPGQLASMLPNIVQELEAAGPVLAAQLEAARVEAEEQHRRWQEEDRRRREAEARALQEKRRQEARTDLLAAIAAWDEARGIAACFDEVEREAEKLGAEERQQLLTRVALARELLGKSNPLDLLLQWKAPDERR